MPELSDEHTEDVDRAVDAIEAALHNNNPDAVRSAENGVGVLVALIDDLQAELQRLREERRVLAEAIKARGARETAYTKGVVTQEQFNVLILKDQAAQEKALALLDPKGAKNRG